MDSKDGKKKESIDEILSDLNGLLNKMPSILDGIKMPEIKPVEFVKPEPVPAPEPEPVKKDTPASPDADKTIILEAFSGLPEGAAAPEEKPVEPAQDAGDKTMIIEAFSRLPEGAQAPEPEKLVPQSLGDFMFGEDAQAQNAEQPAAEPAAAEQPVPTIAEFTPAADQKPEPGFAEDAEGFPAIEPETPADAQPEPEKPVAGLSAAHAYESTRDFGVPDIDALMQLSEGDIKDLTGPEASLEPASDPMSQPEPDKAEPSMNELADFEKQLNAAAPQGEAMENKPEEQKPEIQQEPEGLVLEPASKPETGFEGLTIEPETQAAPEAAQTPAGEPEGLVLEPASKPETGFEGLTLEPETQAAPEAAQTPAGEPEGLVLEPASKPEAGFEGLTLEPEPQAAPEAAETLQLEPSSAVNAAPAAGIELSIGSQPEAQPAAVQPEPLPADKAEETLSVSPREPGLVLEPASAAISGSAASGDETLVMPPPAGGSGEEDKTVIFEAGAGPGVTSRSQAGDLAGLAERPVPEGIPAERVRSVCFFYASEDKALCATVLAELDSICLKSAAKPMFVKRASVRECDPEMNANYILQTVTDAGGQGLVCVGAIPQEKLYEIETAFSGSGGFFRHYDSAGFSHSSALDLVTELILR